MVYVSQQNQNINQELENIDQEPEDINQESPPFPDTPYITFEQMNTIIDFRRLWVDLTIWLRALLMSIMYNQGNLSAVVNRLYNAVPLNFYNTLNVFYGPQLSEHFLALLSNFIVFAWRLSEAQKNGDSAAASAITIQWYQNADEIAYFLARLNPYWDINQWKALLHQYIGMAIEEMQAIATGDYERDILIYDRMINQALIISSYMSRGIIASDSMQNRQPQA